MTKSEQQLQELCDMGVTVVSCPDATTRKAVAFCDDFLVLGQLEGETDAHAVLTHEKWHYKLGAVYRHDAPYEQRCRAEAQVNRAALQELVPKCRLAALLRQGLSVSEVAETLDVPEAQIWEAWRFYRDTDDRFCTGED